MATEQSTDNFYVLLGLSVDCTSWNEIEASIKRCQEKWTRASARDPESQRRLDLLPQIIESLTNPKEREAIRIEAGVIYDEIRQHADETVRSQLRILEKQGHVTEAQVAGLAKKFQEGGWTVERILSEVRVDIRQTATPKAKERTDPSALVQIKKDLGIVKAPDLYAFLQAPPASSLPAIPTGSSLSTSRYLERATAIDQEFLTKPAGTTPAAVRRLATRAKVIFSSDSERAKYDAARAYEKLNGVRDTLELFKDTEVPAAVVEEIITEAMAGGASRDEVLGTIREFARKRSLLIQLPDVNQLQQCGSGHVVMDESRDHCPKCGQRFESECPNGQCGQRVRATDRNCAGCGFPAGEMPIIDQEIVAATVLVDAACAPSGDVQELLAARAAIDSIIQGHGLAPYHVAGLKHLQERLAAIPPPPPSGLTADGSEAVHLSWKTVGQPITAYAIRRKTGSAPTGPDDGEEIYRGTQRATTDTGAPSSDELYYSAFSLRGETWSAPSVPCQHVVVRPPGTPEVRADARKVVLRWTVERGLSTKSRFVVRRSAAQSSDDSVVQSGPGTELIDEAVRTGVAYTYRVIHEIVSQAGRRYASPPVEVTVTPREPPPPVERLGASTASDVVMLSWASPIAGEVLIYRTGSDPGLSIGQQIRPDLLAKWSGPLNSAGPGSAADDNPQSVAYYIPVTKQGDLLVIGSALRFRNLPQVTGLAAHRTGASLALRWSWPRDVRLCRVTVSRANCNQNGTVGPSLHDKTITRADYEAAGRYVVPSAPDGELETHVQAGITLSDGTREFNTTRLAGSVFVVGKSTTGEVSYSVRIRRRGIFGRTRNLLIVDLSIKGEARRLPGLLVVGRGEFVPLRPGDGRRIARIPSGLKLQPGRSRSVELEIPDLPDNVRVRLFSEDDALTMLHVERARGGA